jgi:hypothetical protein
VLRVGVLASGAGTNLQAILDRAGAADRGVGAADDVEDRLVERAGLARGDRPLRELRAATLTRGRGPRRRCDRHGGQRGIADVAAGNGRLGRRAVAEVAQDALAAAAVALDPRPHGAVLAPARAGALLRGRAAVRQRAGVPVAGHAAHHAVGR